MESKRFWHGVRMRRLLAGADPDALPRRVTIPAPWEDDAADALAGLVGGDGPAVLADAADAWIRPIEDRAAAAGLEAPLGVLLRQLLLGRRGAPGYALWRGPAMAHTDDDEAPRFVLNLAAFHDLDLGFDETGFAEAVQTAALALGFASRRVPAPTIGFADLDGLVAAAGFAYDSADARSLACHVARLLSNGLDTMAQRFPALPRPTVLITPAGPTEALLGVETAGFAPAFMPVGASGRLSRASRAFLAARGIAPDAALAAFLTGDSPLPVATGAAHAAMHDALAPVLTPLPPRPVANRPAPAAIRRRELPARRSGYTQRATVGGHALFLRTGEYADGTLGEITVASPKESPAFRGLLDSFAAAVSVGLQHGVPLDAFVDALGGTRFGAAGAVEGDPGVGRATSPVDYVFRHLAAGYLGRTVPAAPPEESTDGGEEAAAHAPLLPLELPPDASPRTRRRALRVISS